jgi:hypothetical protein
VFHWARMQAFFTKNKAAFLAGLVLILTADLHTAAFPFVFVNGRTLSVAEAGYVCLAPLAVWLTRRRSMRMTALVAWGGVLSLVAFPSFMAKARHVLRHDRPLGGPRPVPAWMGSWRARDSSDLPRRSVVRSGSC